MLYRYISIKHYYYTIYYLIFQTNYKYNVGN